MDRSQDGAPNLRLRPATEADASLLLAWRNDPDVRVASRNTAEVEPGEHEAWLREALGSPDRHLLICEDDGRPVGQVRIDRLGERRHEISISLDRTARGRGISVALIRLGLEWLGGVEPEAVVEAHVREENSRSMAAFRRAGFAPAGEEAGFQVLQASAHGA